MQEDKGVREALWNAQSSTEIRSLVSEKPQLRDLIVYGDNPKKCGKGSFVHRSVQGHILNVSDTLIALSVSNGMRALQATDLPESLRHNEFGLSGHGCDKWFASTVG